MIQLVETPSFGRADQLVRRKRSVDTPLHTKTLHNDVNARTLGRGQRLKLPRFRGAPAKLTNR